MFRTVAEPVLQEWQLQRLRRALPSELAGLLAKPPGPLDAELTVRIAAKLGYEHPYRAFLAASDSCTLEQR